MAWYGDVRKWDSETKDKIIWSSGLSLTITVPLTLFFSFAMWFCGDDPRYREEDLSHVWDKSAYEMHVDPQVPTPKIITQ